MISNNNNTDERGQVGIGTLIVFIAMVLVAAIAAGVLINTAGLLQSQAEATGEESTAQVSNQVLIQSATGVTDADNDNIEDIELQVALAPGSDAVDLEAATFQYLGENGVDDLDAADIGADTRLTDSGDTVTLEIDVSDSGDLDGSDNEEPGAGETIEFTITTEDGAQTLEILTVPDPLTENAVRL